MIDKFEIISRLRKEGKLETLVAEFNIQLTEYLDKMKTADEEFVLMSATKYLIGLRDKKLMKAAEKKRKEENGG